MRVLVTGADGQLGRDVLDALAGRVPAGGRRCSLLAPEGPLPGVDYEVLATDIGTMRVDDRDAVQYLFHAFRPDLVLHCGALTAVDLCETDVDLAYAVNALGTRNVAEAALAVGAHLLYVSTDYVFDGTAEGAYREWDAPNPLSVYGASKLAGERECPPVTNSGTTTWWGLVRATLAAAGQDPDRVHAISHTELEPPRPARRPANSVLDNMALRLSGLPPLPDWEDGLVRLVNALATEEVQA